MIKMTLGLSAAVMEKVSTKMKVKSLIIIAFRWLIFLNLHVNNTHVQNYSKISAINFTSELVNTVPGTF